MTSISSSTSALSMMDARINKAASAGTISSTDQTALDSALGNIASQLSSSGVGSASGADMKSKVDTLIQDQVSAGTLTSDQATELQGFFAKGAHVHHGGGHGGGNAIAALVGSTDTTGDADDIATVDATASSSTDGSSTTATSGVSTDQDTEQTQLNSMITFLQNLRSSITSATYGSSTASPSANTGVLINAAA